MESQLSKDQPIRNITSEMLALKKNRIPLTTEMIPQEFKDSYKFEFECCVCYDILMPTNDEFGCTECNECEVAICFKCIDKIKKRTRACPNCRSKDGFRKKLTRHRKE